MHELADDLALAVTLRDLAQKAHNERRDRDRLRPVEFPAWNEIAVDERDAWRAVARYVHANYTLNTLDRAKAVTAAELELSSRFGKHFTARQCADAARAVLSLACLVRECPTTTFQNQNQKT